MDNIRRFVHLDGLEARKQKQSVQQDARILVKHDEVICYGKGLVQQLIEQAKGKENG